MQKFESIAAGVIAQVSSLQKAVSSLACQLRATEAALQRIQLDDTLRVSGQATGEATEMQTGDTLTASEPSIPFGDNLQEMMCHGSQAAESSTQHTSSQVKSTSDCIDGKHIMSRYFAAASYRLLPVSPTSSANLLGPFVSVPISMLPPRSKLHWDMCEFVAQLQAESDSRLSAQLAAQRLCTATVQSLWPRAQVRPYGSFVTRLALPSRCSVSLNPSLLRLTPLV